MADASTGKTETQATIESVVSTLVQDVLTDSMVAWPTVMDFSAQVGPGMDTLKIPRFGRFTVGSKSENTAIDAQINTWAADSLLLDKYKVVQFLVEDIASLQAKVGVIQAYLEQAAKDLAADMDNIVIDGIEAGASAAAPDHQVKYADTLTNVMAAVDFLEARRLLNVQNVPLSDRVALIPADKEKDIMQIAQFVRVNESGSDQTLRNGYIGRLYGFDVLTSNQLSTGISLFYHKTCSAVARQLMPKVETLRDLPNLADRWSVSHIYGYKTLDSGKRQVQFSNT